ncbi:MAG: DUF11 domain-containing protein [Acidobacteria bacterium]|nr:DUF11 domain-containing protein [Acidobacteriota bacterium]
MGNINTTVTLVKGGTATFSLTATISASATGSLTNTATVATPPGTSDPTPGNNTATDTDTLTPQADLAMSKTDNSATYIPGGTVVYTIVATNNGPSVVTNALITDTLPASITSATWTCVASAGSSCTANGTGSINATATLLVNGTATFTLTAQVSPNATGNLVNTANVAPPQGTTDPNPGNNSATDTDTPNPQADLTINKTDGVDTYTAGLSTTYTILVTNTGPSSVNNAAVVDTLPTGITSATWSCVASVNGNCDAANGSGNINTTVNLAPGATATFTVVAQISSTATGNLVNTATVALPAGPNDPNQQNNSSTDTDTPDPRADLAITKTDGVTTATPGGQTVYTIVATNNGPSAVFGVSITDTFPAAITSATWTCTSAGGAICPNANGTGNINETADLPVGSSLTFTVTAQISPNATGQLINTATVDVDSEIFTDPNPSNNTATDIDTLGPAADIVVQKNGTGIVQINGAVNYTIEIKNLGPSSANGTTFSDTLPAGLGSPTAICTSALAGAVCPGVLNVGGGTVTGTIPTLPPGGNLVITITGTAPGTIGSMTNVATATPPQGVTDPNPGNNTSAAMTQVINTPVPPVANLAVVKVGPGTVQTNGTITYYVTVNNAGPGAANGASFSDTVPAAITNVSWTCQSAGGAVCPNNNGAGNVIAQTIATFPANGQLVYTITGTAPQSAQSLTNTATIATPPGDRS